MIVVREVDTPSECRQVSDVLDQVWGTAGVVSVELLRAAAHSGSFVAAAFEHAGPGAAMIGASFGLRAEFRGRPALHSHVTGVLPGREHAGIGGELKLFQQRWAARHAMAAVTWTFDPLVRRNAWFNLHVLGAEVDEYLVDFYGPIGDAINRHDESDRLLVVWELDAGRRPAIEPERDDPLIRLVPTPPDIVALRAHAPDEARRWRAEVRAGLDSPLRGGGRVLGMTAAGEYVVALRR
jgi:predicted GNAT superfamily acetyltransferase